MIGKSTCLGPQPKWGGRGLPAVPRLIGAIRLFAENGPSKLGPFHVSAGTLARDSPYHRCTRPDPPPLISAFTSSTVVRSKSPGTLCFRQLAATANSSASWREGSFCKP